MRTKAEGAQAAQSAMQDYQHQINELQAELDAIGNDRQKAEAELQTALGEVGAVILPSSDAATIAAAVQATGLQQLPGRRAEFEQQRPGWTARLQAIESDGNFIQRGRLLHPENGTIVVEQAQCRKLVAQLNEYLQRFQIEPFLWLQNRELQKETSPGAFSSFLRTITFGAAREEKAKQRCCAELGFPSWEELSKAYEHAVGQHRQAETRIQQLDAHRAAVLKMVTEHGQLYQWVHHFEDQLLQVLRQEIGQLLVDQDLKAVHRAVPSAARKSAAKCHGLKKKIQYFQDLQHFLNNEIMDRRNRIASIDKVRQQWLLKPYAYLSGDKTKWLVTVPALKRKSAHKRRRWVRDMHEAIDDYDDWDWYDYYLWHDNDFLSYDAFAYRYQDSVPYEGFSRKVLGELEEYRVSHHQVKPDYSTFKEYDKKAGLAEKGGPAEPADDSGKDKPEEYDGGIDVAEAAAAVVVAEAAMEMIDAS
ncbi:MAG: hypothetical protein AAGF12_04235 [Myxococcota bacterium]